MKKILSLAAVASMALAGNAAEKSPYQDMNYKDWGKLYLNGNQLSSTITKKEVQLKGWSTFSMHYKGHCENTKAQYALMKEYGANIVRLAMYVDDPSPYDGGGYKQNDGSGANTKFTDMIKDGIEFAKSLDMYVLVDWHILEMNNGSSGDPNKYTDMAKKFFNEISKYCAEKGYDHVLYEICNEPTCGWSNIKKYAHDVIPSITNNQPDAIIVVGTDQWCQEVEQAANDPVDSNYKKNVMYSFHYYACSHTEHLGKFRNAQKIAPVFVSEWSAVKFNGDGPFCKGSGDDMIASCDYQDVAPQIVSWCIWNWGTKKEASSFFSEGGCNANNLSQYKDNEGNLYSDYVKELMAGELRDVVVPDNGPWETINEIPTSAKNLWHWDYFDLGGEQVAYHDGNGTAYDKDDEGVYKDYKIGDEFDIFSQAYDMLWLEKRHDYAEIDRTDKKHPKVISYKNDVKAKWGGGDTYRSLNGGRMWGGTDASDRGDDGVDLSAASMAGTGVTGKYTVLAYVEEGEWINYTVNVAKPGYYKISGYISAEYVGKGLDVSLYSTKGNLLRDASNLSDNKSVTAFGFKAIDGDEGKCAKSGVKLTGDDKAPWDCWQHQDATSKKIKSVVCAFVKEGEQELYVRFQELGANAGGVGPLEFEWVADIDPNDPITSVEEVSNDSEFAIYPNPTSGEFTVVLAENTEATVEVVNMAGQIVASQVVEGTATINKALAAGIYTVVVKANGSVSTQKLVVK